MKIPFGILQGQLVNVADVTAGLECNCFCPACGERLVAKKGTIKIHHFSHHDGKQCDAAAETVAHLLAKKILNEHRRIRLPAVYGVPGIAGRTSGLLVRNEATIEFDKIEIEKRLEGITPDLIGYARSTPLLIEICVTHPADNERIRRIAQMGISAVELVVGRGIEVLNQDVIRDLILGDTTHKRWLWNIKAHEFRMKYADAIGLESYPMPPDSFRYCDNNYAYFPTVALHWRAKEKGWFPLLDLKNRL
jgi:hypothetical protein